jgi:cytochrome d ubiquinol oxidase subunit II
MDIWNLNTLWFTLIAVLWIGYFFLEGFDFGAGMLLPFVSEDDMDRRVVINTLGPVWDGNEVWLLVAGGATFAAFPEWYATLFSGFYLPLFLILVALIIRGVAFEFRGKDDRPRWKATWDWAIVAGSFLPALLWGVAFANILRGVPIEMLNGHLEYTGGFWGLLNPYALLGGLASLSIFLLHGSLFLSLKTEGGVKERVDAVMNRLAWPAVVLVLAFMVWTYVSLGEGIVPGLLPLLAVAALLSIPFLAADGRMGWAFIANGAAIALVVATLFITLYPNVLPSSVDPAFSLDVYNAASTNLTLKVMTVVAVIFTPIVLIYQSWSYWIFRKRLGRTSLTSAGH